MTGRDPIIIDALVANRVEKGSTSSIHLSGGELDHARLAQDLQDHGLIDDKAQWQAPGKPEITESLSWIASKHSDDLVVRRLRADGQDQGEE